jgi:hypothetical protein
MVACGGSAGDAQGGCLKNTKPLYFRSRKGPKFYNFGYDVPECSCSERSDKTNRKILDRFDW